jgi:hypothetical protein
MLIVLKLISNGSRLEPVLIFLSTDSSLELLLIYGPVAIQEEPLMIGRIL